MVYSNPVISMEHLSMVFLKTENLEANGNQELIYNLKRYKKTTVLT
jgi:hypothetical protein